VTTITDGIGSNESPAFSPNGRHIAFTSTRAGNAQIFTIDRQGRNLRQITKSGMNRYPNWSQYPVDARSSSSVGESPVPEAGVRRTESGR
jgi:Tol biopolymer transport system component